MKPEQIEISNEKISKYVLVVKLKTDKSKFLSSIGYTKENWSELLNDIIKIALNNDLNLQRKSEFWKFVFYKRKIKE